MGAELTPAGAPWELRLGQKKPCPNETSAIQEEKPRFIPESSCGPSIEHL